MKFPICFSFSLFSTSSIFYISTPLFPLFTITTLLVPLLVIISSLAYPSCHHRCACASLLPSPLPLCVDSHGLLLSLFIILLSVFHSSSIYLSTTNTLFSSADSEVTGASDSMYFEFTLPRCESACCFSALSTVEVLPSLHWLWIVLSVIWHCILTQWSPAHCQLWKLDLHLIDFELSALWFESAYLPSEVQRTVNCGGLTFMWLALNLRLHTYPAKSSALPTLEARPSFDWLWIVGFVIWDCTLTQWSPAHCQLWRLDLHLIGFELSASWFETAYLPSEVQRTANCRGLIFIWLIFELSATWFESAYLPRCPAHYHLCKL